MPLQVGLNVVEVDGRAAPALQAALTSVAAFAGVTERGVPSRAVRVTSLDQVAARFGGFRRDGYLAYALTGFFLNGGREAYVVRVAGAGSLPATTTLLDRQATAAPRLRVTAGYRGAPDPGVWGQTLRLDVRDDPRANTVTSAATTTPNALPLVSIAGIGPGSVLRIGAGAGQLSRTVTAVDPVAQTVTLDAALGTTVTAGTAVVSAEFRLIVRRLDATGSFPIVEQWPTLSMVSGSADNVADQINHQLLGSRYVTVSVLGAPAAGVDVPAVASGVALFGGTETAPTALDLLGDAATRTGLHALDTAAVQLLAVPDAHRLDPDGRRTVVRGALDYCAARGDCTYVGSGPDRGAPAGSTPRSPADYTQPTSSYVDDLSTYAAQFQAAKVYGALYAPWVLVADPAGAGPSAQRFIPPEGHVMGVYARTEQERGIHKAPAGDAATLRGVLDLAAAFSDSEHDDLVRTGRTNGIRSPRGQTPAIAASRTLSTDTRWQFVNVRLLFNFVKATLRDGLRFARQEPNTDALRRMVKFNVVTPFLLGLWQQGAFGSDPAKQVFTIKCDAENNPPADVDQGLFRIEVYFYAARPAETIQIIVGQQPSGGTAAEG